MPPKRKLPSVTTASKRVRHDKGTWCDDCPKMIRGSRYNFLRHTHDMHGSGPWCEKCQQLFCSELNAQSHQLEGHQIVDKKTGHTWQYSLSVIVDDPSTQQNHTNEELGVGQDIWDTIDGERTLTTWSLEDGDKTLQPDLVCELAGSVRQDGRLEQDLSKPFGVRFCCTLPMPNEERMYVINKVRERRLVTRLEISLAATSLEGDAVEMDRGPQSVVIPSSTRTVMRSTFDEVRLNLSGRVPQEPVLLIIKLSASVEGDPLPLVNFKSEPVHGLTSAGRSDNSIIAVPKKSERHPRHSERLEATTRKPYGHPKPQVIDVLSDTEDRSVVRDLHSESTDHFLEHLSTGLYKAIKAGPDSASNLLLKANMWISHASPEMIQKPDLAPGLAACMVAMARFDKHAGERASKNKDWEFLTTLSSEFLAKAERKRLGTAIHEPNWWTREGVPEQDVLGTTNTQYPTCKQLISKLLTKSRTEQFIHQYVRLYCVNLTKKTIQRNLTSDFVSTGCNENNEKIFSRPEPPGPPKPVQENPILQHDPQTPSNLERVGEGKIETHQPEASKSKLRQVAMHAITTKTTTPKMLTERDGKLFSVHIGNLPPEAEAASLSCLFKAMFTSCKNVVVMKGYGFVEFTNQIDQDMAIGRSVLYLGHEISVNERKRRSSLAGLTKVYINFRNTNLGKDDLRSYFVKYGTIKDIHTVSHMGYGFITYAEHEQAGGAIGEHLINGQRIISSWPYSS